MIYLDYAASAPIRAGALNILDTSMKEDFANPSSSHKLGKGLHKRIEACRSDFLGYLGASTGDRLVFTASATECNNMVMMGIGLKEGDTAAVCFADHPSVTVPAEQLADRNVRILEIPLKPGGTVDEPAFLQSLDENVKLVVLSHVNNQSGVVTDVCRLGREIKNVHADIHVHVDAAQGFGKLPLSMKECQKGIDTLCVSAHKIGGPKGAAALFLRSGVNVSPLLYGGSQENGFRASTRAAPLIYSFCEAARDAVENIESSLAHVTELNRLTRERVKKKIETAEFPFTGASSPFILAFLLPGISSDIILRHLEQKDIYISSTSACSSRIKGANAVFTALHIPPNRQKHVLRVSFATQTTRKEVGTFCDSLAIIYDELSMYFKHKAQ